MPSSIGVERTTPYPYLPSLEATSDILGAWVDSEAGKAMNRRSKKTLAGVLIALCACTVSVITTLMYQAHLTSSSSPNYVALGSSFAAGLGLGERAPGSPFMCQRSINGYPQQLARATGLPVVDMTCAGSTAEHVLHGGQYFQGAQLDAVKSSTQLVTDDPP